MPSRLLRENVALSISAALVLVAGFRIYAFTNFDVPNALAVLSVVDYFKILLSSLVSALSTFIPYILLVFVFDADFRRWVFNKEKGSDHVFRWVYAVTLFSILSFGILALTNFMALIYLLCFGIYAFNGFLKKRKLNRGEKSGRRAGRMSWRQYFPIIPVVISLAFSSVVFESWTPLETIQVKNEMGPIRGYVIGEAGAHTLIVLEHKTPHWITTEDVEARQLCQGDEPWLGRLAFVSLVELFGPERLADQSLGLDLCTDLGSQIERPETPQG